MTIATARSLVCSVVLLSAPGSAGSLHAQLGVGTWVRKATASMPAMTMTVEACCNGTETLLTVESRFDGSDADVLFAGKPSGETMGITRVDEHHVSTVVKMNGKPFGTSKATLSPDGKLLTVVNDFSSSVGGAPAGKTTEIWVRK